MKRRLLSLLATMLFVACERNDRGGAEDSRPGPVPAKVALRPDADAPGPRRASRPDPGDRLAGVVESAYRLPDDELWTLLEEVDAEDDPRLKRELRAAIYEETRLRPDFARFPLLLGIARQPDVDPGLRNTILADLGTALSTEHGASWADWAMAIDEHLARSEGLIRVE